MTTATKPVLGPHTLDDIPLGGIVTVRDRLLEMQAKGKPILPARVGRPVVRHPGPRPRGDGAGPSRRADPLHGRRRNSAAPQGDPREADAGQPPPASRAGERPRDERRHARPLHHFPRPLLAGRRGDPPRPDLDRDVRHRHARGGVPVRCPLDEAHGYAYNPSRIEALVTKRTRAIVVNSPHNPTAPSCRARRSSGSSRSRTATASSSCPTRRTSTSSSTGGSTSPPARSRGARASSSPSTRCPRATR